LTIPHLCGIIYNYKIGGNIVTEIKKEKRIPEISDEKLREILKRVRPVVRFLGSADGLFADHRGALYYIKEVDPRGVAFTWLPMPDGKASGLKTLLGIQTYHVRANNSLFKPSLAEVIAQIPEEIINKVVAFETKTDAVKTVGLCHVTETVLYTY